VTLSTNAAGRERARTFEEHSSNARARSRNILPKESQRCVVHLWSPVVATGGNQWQMPLARERRKQAKTVAVGRDQLMVRNAMKKVLGTQIRRSCCSGVFVDQSAESVAAAELLRRAGTEEA
jgi:hypothetical protein